MSEAMVIKDKDIAKKVVDIMVEVNATLIETVTLVKEHCAEHDFIEFRTKIAAIIGKINTEIIDSAIKEYPELNHDGDHVENQLEIYANRLHIIDGLITAVQHSEQIRAVLTQQADQKAKIIEAFHLSDAQAQAILDLKVPLDQIEVQLLVDEKDKLMIERRHFEEILKK